LELKPSLREFVMLAGADLHTRPIARLPGLRVSPLQRKAEHARSVTGFVVPDVSRPDASGDKVVFRTSRNEHVCLTPEYDNLTARSG